MKILITVDEDKRNFEALVNILKLREYDFLDYRWTFFLKKLDLIMN